MVHIMIHRQNCRVKTILTSLLILIFYTSISAQNSYDYIAKGDQYLQHFDNPKALEQYRKAYQVDSTNCTALWKMAETHVNLGEEAGKITQRQHYYLAEKWARKAVSVCPDTANAHFFVAVTTGLLALYEGGQRQIQRSKEVKEEAEKTLEIDPNHHGAYHVLGRWHRELANLSWIKKTLAKIIYGGVPPGASMEAAVRNFKKAIAIKPDWINHHKELGLTYMEMGKWDLVPEPRYQLLDQIPFPHFQRKNCKTNKLTALSFHATG